MKQTKVLIKLANILCFSTHQRCLCVNNSFVINNPPCSPFLCVTFLQSSNLKRYHSKLLKTHIKGTQRRGEHGGEKVKTISRRCQRHKERQSRSVHIAERSGYKRFNKSCKPLLCNEVGHSINKTRKSPLFLHAPTVPLCLTISAI